MPIDIEHHTGSIFGDAADWVSDRVDDVGDAVSDVGDFVHDNIPGGEWVVDAVNAGAGWIATFAKTGVGTIVMRAISSAMFPAFSATLGPQVASVAFAFPGIVKGDRFTEAYITEVAHRTSETARILGSDVAEQVITGPLKDTVAKLIKQLADKTGGKNLLGLNPAELMKATGLTPAAAAYMKELGLTPESVAKQFGIRQDVAQMVLDVLNQTTSDLTRFDVATGKPLPTRSLASAPISTSATAQSATELKVSLAKAKEMKMPTAVITALQKKYDAAVAEEKARKAVVSAITKPGVASAIAALGVNVSSNFQSSSPQPSKTSASSVAAAIMAQAPSSLSEGGASRGEEGFPEPESESKDTLVWILSGCVAVGALYWFMKNTGRLQGGK